RVDEREVERRVRVGGGVAAALGPTLYFERPPMFFRISGRAFFVYDGLEGDRRCRDRRFAFGRRGPRPHRLALSFLTGRDLFVDPREAAVTIPESVFVGTRREGDWSAVLRPADLSATGANQRQGEQRQHSRSDGRGSARARVGHVPQRLRPHRTFVSS